MKQTRVQKERRVIETMVELYCKGQKHSGAPLCPGCRELCGYAKDRLARCRRGEEKTFCGHCAANCYSPAMRERMRSVMRYSGPRMMLYHPLMAVRHALYL